MRIPTIGKKEWGQIVDKERTIKHVIQLGISLKENKIEYINHVSRTMPLHLFFVIIVNKIQNIKNSLDVRYIRFSAFCLKEINWEYRKESERQE